MADEAQPKKKSRKGLWITLGIVAFLIIVIAAAGNSTPSKVGETNTSGSNTNSSTVYDVGDKIQLGKSIVTVNDVQYSQGGQFTKPSEGNEWLNINLTIENTDSSQQSVTTLGQMFVRDGEGNSYQVASTDKTIENISQSLDGTILANSKRTGWVGFEIKKNATGLQFQYNGSIFGGGTILVNLGR